VKRVKTVPVAKAQESEHCTPGQLRDREKELIAAGKRRKEGSEVGNFSD
jgi:hypothetical protein